MVSVDVVIGKSSEAMPLWREAFCGVRINISGLKQMMQTLPDRFEGMIEALRQISYHISMMDSWIEDIESNLREQGSQIEGLRADMDRLLSLNQGSHIQNNQSMEVQAMEEDTVHQPIQEHNKTDSSRHAW